MPLKTMRLGGYFIKQTDLQLHNQRKKNWERKWVIKDIMKHTKQKQLEVVS